MLNIHIMEISLQQGDITRMKVDAIVNAANNSLLGGGGVDGAIHRAAGPELLEACRALHGCPTGDAKITRGFLLPASYVIHAVGPVWRGGAQQEDAFLASCYNRSLQIATQYQLQTIAFPNISTGVYGFPKRRAAQIAIETVRNFSLKEQTSLQKVTFVCYDQENYNLYFELLDK
jgi:O-acetyl-ADP-ribose deacetylase (regulator of RNase III)